MDLADFFCLEWDLDVKRGVLLGTVSPDPPYTLHRTYRQRHALPKTRTLRTIGFPVVSDTPTRLKDMFYPWLTLRRITSSTSGSIAKTWPFHIWYALLPRTSRLVEARLSGIPDALLAYYRGYRYWLLPNW